MSLKPNCFEKTEAGGAFFIFHQITDELSTKHFPRLRTTDGAMSRFALQKCSNLAQMLLANLLIARVMCRFLFTNLI